MHEKTDSRIVAHAWPSAESTAIQEIQSEVQLCVPYAGRYIHNKWVIKWQFLINFFKCFKSHFNK